MCITGAAGQTAYNLAFSIGSGDAFGKEQVSVPTCKQAWFSCQTPCAEPPPLDSTDNTCCGMQPVSIRLLDLPLVQSKLKGLKMELEDCAFPLCKTVSVHSRLLASEIDLMSAMVSCHSCLVLVLRLA